MIYKYAVISVVTIAVIGLATWTTYLSYQPQNSTPTKLALLPDVLMEDVIAIVIDKQGKPSMKIVTPKMIHFPENDTTHITAPELTLYRKSSQP
ncbi:MAG: LPS export ABC transporter periplasmic protein LptC, partial [Gammaproteobacteria bacterium]|nr:LPS export ABC transporter periplasmic protein LptC [Gammaproteobacteria bacterium]